MDRSGRQNHIEAEASVCQQRCYVNREASCYVSGTAMFEALFMLMGGLICGWTCSAFVTKLNAEMYIEADFV